MTSYLILGITFAFAAAVQPGPLLTFLVSKTLSNGWRSTLPAAFAPVISDGPIFILALLILSNIPENFIYIIQISGGLFLFYLSYRAYKSWQTYDADKVLKPQSSRQTVLSATMVNLLNPAPYIGWSLVMGPLFLKGWRETPIYGIALIVGFYITMVICLMGIIILFSSARRLGPKVSRSLLGLSAIALACFGIYEFYIGIGYYL